jgi:uncharacterized NAD(P)/FAD-binding protein YdhS
LSASLTDDFNSPTGTLRWIRREIKAAEESGSNWRAVIDSLRPHTAAIWQGWSMARRASFLRHARNIWDIHRHRLAPEVADRLSVLLEDRTLLIHRGRLDSARLHRQAANVTWRETGFNELRAMNVNGLSTAPDPPATIPKFDHR